MNVSRENWQERTVADRRSPDRSDRRAPRTPRSSGKAKPQGHEAFLKALESSSAVISLTMIDGGDVQGIVKHSDKFTISLEIEGTVHVIFKHSIASFFAVTPREV